MHTIDSAAVRAREHEDQHGEHERRSGCACAAAKQMTGPLELARLVERDRQLTACLGRGLLERLSSLPVQVRRGEVKHVDIPEREHPLDRHTVAQLERYQAGWELIA